MKKKLFTSMLVILFIIASIFVYNTILKPQNNSKNRNNTVPKSCLKYFDGCNTCTRGGGCTEMYCFEYKQPKCLDDISN